MEQQTLKTVDIKGKPYVEVSERIKYFRTAQQFKDWALVSDLVSNNNGVCIIKASVINPDGITKATGYAYEKETNSYINKTSYIENCETSAWGRALGNLGIGVGSSIASADEMINAIANQTTGAPAKKTLPQTNNDTDLFAGLRACSDLDNLKIYYERYQAQVSDKKEFAKIKDEMKKKLFV